MNRRVLSIVLALMLASCGKKSAEPPPSAQLPAKPTHSGQLPREPTHAAQLPGVPTTVQAGACCDILVGIDEYVVSSKVPVVTNVCVGADTLWSAEMRPGKPLAIPIAKLAAGKQAGLQFFVGTDQRGCLDAASLAKLPPAREGAEIMFTYNGVGINLLPCGTGAGCTCPKCPQPVVQ